MALIRIDYPENRGGFEVEGKDADEAVKLAYFAITTLWGRKTITNTTKYGDKPLTLDEVDSWLGK